MNLFGFDGLEKILNHFNISISDKIVSDDIKLKKKVHDCQFDIFDTELTASVVNYYINGASILEISEITNLENYRVEEILDRVIPYLD